MRGVPKRRQGRRLIGLKWEWRGRLIAIDPPPPTPSAPPPPAGASVFDYDHFTPQWCASVSWRSRKIPSRSISSICEGCNYPRMWGPKVNVQQVPPGCFIMIGFPFFFASHCNLVIQIIGCGKDGVFNMCVCSLEVARCIINASIIIITARGQKTESCNETFISHADWTITAFLMHFSLFFYWKHHQRKRERKNKNKQKKQLNPKPKSNPNIHRCTDSFSKITHTEQRVCRCVCV